MKIYTSYFANLKKLPKDVVPIAICGKSPAGYRGFEYKILAPKYSFFQVWKQNHDNNYYIKHFNDEVLSTLNAKKVYENLQILSGGQDVALICYEKPGDFCHRHLVAEWLSKELGISVEEYQQL